MRRPFSKFEQVTTNEINSMKDLGDSYLVSDVTGRMEEFSVNYTSYTEPWSWTPIPSTLYLGSSKIGNLVLNGGNKIFGNEDGKVIELD